MKTLLKFKPSKPATPYMLEIAPLTAPSYNKKGRVKGGFSYVKKIIVAMLLGLLVVTGTATAAVASTAASEQANAAFDLFNPGTWVCDTKDSAFAYLDGSSDTISYGAKDEVRNSPVNSGFNITITSSAESNPYVNGNNGPASGQRWTALEQYGYFAPSFENWKGLLYEDKYDGDWPFIGTGGGGNAAYGPLVGVSEGNRSLLLNTDFGSCAMATFGTGFNVGFANGIFSITKFFTMLSSETYGIAMNMDITNPTSPLHGLAVGIEDLITGGDNPNGGLKNIFYLDWLIGIIFLATIWLIWIGIVRRSFLAAGQGILWMIGASIAGIILLSNPLMIPKFIDTVASDINASISGALMPEGASNADFCVVPSGADSGDNAIRQVKCTIWYMNVYTPWVKGQFGINEYDLAPTSAQTGWMYSDSYQSSRPDGNGGAVTSGVVAWGDKTVEGEGFKTASEEASKPSSVNGSRGVLSKANIRLGDYTYEGNVNWAFYMLDRQANWADNRGLDYSEIAFNQLVVNKNAQWGTASDGIGSAMMSIFSAIGPTAILFSMSLILIGLQLSMLFLIALSPFFFLLGAAPGWGRRIAMRWLELIVGILVKRIVLSIILLLFLQIYFLIIKSEIDWWIQAIVVFVLSIVAFTQRDKVTSIFNNAIDFGGNKRFDDGRGMLQAAKQKTVSGTGKAIRGTGWVASKVGGRGGNGPTPGGAKPKPGAKPAPGTKGTPNKPGGTGPAAGGPGTGAPVPAPTSRRGRKEAEANKRAEESAERKAQSVQDSNAAWVARGERRREAAEARSKKGRIRYSKRSEDIRKRQHIDQMEKLRERRTAHRDASAQLEADNATGKLTKDEYGKRKTALYDERKSIRKESEKAKKRYEKDIPKIQKRASRAERRHEAVASARETTRQGVEAAKRQAERTKRAVDNSKEFLERQKYRRMK